MSVEAIQERVDRFFSSYMDLGASDTDVPFRVKVVMSRDHSDFSLCLEATDTIDPGRVVLEEQPCAVAQLPYKGRSIIACQQCLSCSTPQVRCARCSMSFCSQKCLQMAVASWHRVVCCEPTAWNEIQRWMVEALSSIDSKDLDRIERGYACALLACRCYCLAVQSYRLEGVEASKVLRRYQALYRPVTRCADLSGCDLHPVLRRLKRCLLTFEDDDPALSSLFSLETFQALVANLAASSFDAAGGNGKIPGVAVYWILSQLQCSCRPSVAVEGKHYTFASLRAVATTPIMPGDVLSFGSQGNLPHGTSCRCNHCSPSASHTEVVERGVHIDPATAFDDLD